MHPVQAHVMLFVMAVVRSQLQVSEPLVSVPADSSSKLLPKWGCWNADLSTSLWSCRPKSQFLTLDDQVLDLLFSLLLYPLLPPGQASCTSPMLCAQSHQTFAQAHCFCHSYTCSSKVNSYVTSSVNLSFHTSHGPVKLLSPPTPG